MNKHLYSTIAASLAGILAMPAWAADNYTIDPTHT